MEYEPHFTGEETKAAEGHGVQARCEPTSTDPKAQGPLRAVASVVYPLWLFLRVHRSHCCTCGPCPLVQLLAHPGGAGPDRQMPDSDQPADTAAPPPTPQRP